MSFSTTDIKLLEGLGFAFEVPKAEDMQCGIEAYYYRKIEDHAFLKGVNISVREMIDVYCDDLRERDQTLIISKKFTSANLRQILNFLIS